MPLPLSVALMPTGPVTELVELATLAERLGYRGCWLYDEGLVARDVYVALTAIAVATKTIRLGPGITNPYVRHPGATATAIATLDELSGGRAFVGIGAGGGVTLGPLGIDRTKPLTAVREMVAALRGLFAGETVDLDGEVFSLREAKIDYARPDIDVILAGRGPKMTALGGTVADGFNLSYVHKSLLGSHAATLRAAVSENDRPFVITYQTMVATNEADFQAARAVLTFHLVNPSPEVKEMIGMTDADAEAIQAALVRGGRTGGAPRGRYLSPLQAAAELVKPEWVTDFVFTGSLSEAGAEVRDLMDTSDIDEYQVPVYELRGAAERIERTATMFTG